MGSAVWASADAAALARAGLPAIAPEATRVALSCGLLGLAHKAALQVNGTAA